MVSFIVGGNQSTDLLQVIDKFYDTMLHRVKHGIAHLNDLCCKKVTNLSLSFESGGIL
jgi:hypothetical protein